jgi:hypothetical protein
MKPFKLTSVLLLLFNIQLAHSDIFSAVQNLVKLFEREKAAISGLQSLIENLEKNVEILKLLVCERVNPKLKFCFS